MGSKLRSVLVFLTVVAVLLVAGCSPAEAPSPGDGAATPEVVITWLVQTGDPPGPPASQAQVELAERVTAASGGRLVIDMRFGGEIVPRADISEAVRDGALDMGMTTPANDQDLLGDVAFILGSPGFPAGPKSIEYAAWFYQGDGQKYLNEVYQDFGYVIGMPYFSLAELFCHSNVKLETAADLEGVKFRTFGLWAQIMNDEFGSSVVMLPGAELYGAMERGVIDAFEYASPSFNYPMGFHEVAKYVGVPGIHSPMSAYIAMVNKESWDSLPSDLQLILESEVQAAGFRSLLDVTYQDGLAMQQFEDYGTEFVTVSDELQQQIAQAGRDWVEKAAAADPKIQEIWENQAAFIKAFRSYNEAQPRYSIYD